MAQNNSVNESASYSTTGRANAPLNTNSSYTPTTTTNPTITTSHPSSSSDSKISQAGEFTKNMLAAAHGAGEKIRGEFNSGVDRTFHEVCAPVDPPEGTGFPNLGGEGMRRLACLEDGGV